MAGPMREGELGKPRKKPSLSGWVWMGLLTLAVLAWRLGPIVEAVREDVAHYKSIWKEYEAWTILRF